jgi:TonB family protein
MTGLYLLKTVLVAGLLYTYYRLFLRNRSFHLYNRYYLLSVPVVSLLLPALQLKLFGSWNWHSRDNPIRLLAVANGSLEEAVTIYARQGFREGFPWGQVCLAGSLCISLFLLFRLYRSLLYLRQLRRNSPCRELQGARLYFVSQEGTPFSFFSSIFWNEAQELDNARGQQMLQHELYHVRHRHSLDVVMLEAARIFCWFNPFMHLIRREIQVLHEFLADDHAASGTDRLEYAELLLTSSRSPGSLTLTHPFFHNQIKRRITMITNKKCRSGLLGRLMILPLVLLLTGLFAFRFQGRSLHGILASKTIRVVVDAGHGGSFPGVIINGVEEKDLNLQIARKIRQLSKDYGIDVIMTREDDANTGSLLEEDLKYRAALAARENADLFISIHINGGTAPGVKPVPGFEIYLPDKSNPVYSGSVKLGSSITEYIGQDYTIAPELRQYSKGILVLREATVPAILITCGNLDIRSDRDFITNENNQNKIARDILEGIRRYGSDNSSFQSSPPAGDTIVLRTDTITLEALKQKDPNTIYSMDVDKSRNRILVRFKNGAQSVVLITQEMRMQLDSSGPKKKVAEEAVYPGGQAGWSEYLQHHLKYPDEAAKKGIQGEVIVEFIVETDGSLTHIRALSGPDQLRENAVRTIRESGKWVPAKDEGKIVSSYKKQPIVFRLN